MNKIIEILNILTEIDGLARDSRGCYENARACYAATDKIRSILATFVDNLITKKE